jgi:hypothetical protein
MTRFQLVLLNVLEIHKIALRFLQVEDLLLIDFLFLCLNLQQIVKMIGIQYIEQALAYKNLQLISSHTTEL